jgi:hypothetical protein
LHKRSCWPLYRMEEWIQVNFLIIIIFYANLRDTDKLQIYCFFKNFVNFFATQWNEWHLHPETNIEFGWAFTWWCKSVVNFSNFISCRIYPLVFKFPGCLLFVWKPRKCVLIW